jgi:hypothetical protein
VCTSALEVQKIGSTSSCGCDFPHLIYQNGEWPAYVEDETDEERLASYWFNRESLVRLLREIAEGAVELYGVWAGDFKDEPKVREEVTPEGILSADFELRERVFLRVIV